MTGAGGPAFDPREVLSRATDSDWRHVFAEVALLAGEGRWDDLGALRAAAGERAAKPHLSVRERIENLAAADAAGMKALASWIAAESLSPDRLGDLADRLAQAHGWEAIAAAGFRDEILLPAAHARALRREDASHDPRALAAASRAAGLGDPLGTLALAPQPLERAAWLPTHTPDGAFLNLPFGAHVEGLLPVVPRETHLESARLPRKALPAFEHWSRVIAATGRPAGVPSPAAAAGALAALVPEAVPEDATLRCRSVTPEEAWAWLFCAALAGDAAPRRSIARARLAAWRTLAAVAGSADDPAGAAAALGTAAWFVLDVKSGWFGGKARDAAIAARFPAHWVVVAATEG